MFGKIEETDSFTDGECSIIYFPVTGSPDFPAGIRKRTEECIRILITAYESENGCSLDISELCLCARLVVCRKTGCGISIVISGTGCSGRDVWIDEYYKIGCGDPLYGQFKSYFMAQLEKELFGE